MRKPTLQDVARAAGVSYATADRVLNARGLVAEKSQRRVLQAIDELGYERDLHAANLSRSRVYRFCFVLPQGDHSFFRFLREAVVAEQVRRKFDRISADVVEFPAFDGDALADVLDGLQPGYDCVGIVAAETSRATDAIAALVRSGVPVVTLVGDAAPQSRTAYVGIDNLMAGATVGRLFRLAHRSQTERSQTERIQTGRILPVLGAFGSRDHRERLEGALRVLGEPGSGLEVLDAIAIHDRPETMFDLVSEAISQREITGIYSIGAGNRGLIRVLEGLADTRPFVVMHELTPTTRDGLERDLVDAVIDQKPAQEVALAMDVMKTIADAQDLPGATRHITPTIYLKDNLPVAGNEGTQT